MGNINEYIICKANAEEWARYHAIYRVPNFNEWMCLSFQTDISRYAKTDFCYWVTVDNKRIGGAFIKPNVLKCVFNIPPFRDDNQLIEILTQYVATISDKNSPIVVPDADVRQADYYKNIGFNLERVEKTMICPTNEYNITWEERYKIVFPEIVHTELMAKLYYEAYSNNKLHKIASQSYEFQVSNVQVYFNHIKSANITNEWSTLIYDAITKKLLVHV